ncbi:helix-turn-helix domain-containing protein [Bacteroides pyogenes]|uniref:helix-turn-helix domain-containing protein n=1 Tax=Bacteroides pyogenes TaxID=310300 RepID=UPI001BA72CBD|nr:helix-turn-helix domain-containing protein [Bacteroides pyogenes]MBR8705865.1 hypothetical protein [Bacteroides pyogenes]
MRKRNNREINHAISLLRKNGDEKSAAQANVLECRHNEAQVFDQYVRGVSEDEKNEELFFAARDAARYLAGSLSLEELIPGAEVPEYEETEDPDRIMVSRRTLLSLMQRVCRLEKVLGMRKASMKINRKPVEEAETNDLICQADACRYVGCSKSAIKRWADKGLLTGYKKGTRVYFSKRELDKSKVVREHRTCKKIQEE